MGRPWKLELQKLADETGLHVSVCHLPPGSDWLKRCGQSSNQLLPARSQGISKKQIAEIYLDHDADIARH